MQGRIKDLEVESSEDEYDDEDEDMEEEVLEKQETKKPSKGGMFSIFRGLVGRH